MADATDARLRALYRAALDTVPPLSRAVFLMHRLDDLSYRQIGKRLKIDVPTVEACMGEALLMICRFVDGGAVQPAPSALVVAADARLRNGHYLLCRRWIERQRRRCRICWLDPRPIFRIMGGLAVGAGGYARWLDRSGAPGRRVNQVVGAALRRDGFGVGAVVLDGAAARAARPLWPRPIVFARSRRCSE